MAEKQSKINIKPANRGKFTAWWKSKGFKGVTLGCIQQGLKSKDPRVRKMANFAKNSRTWSKN